MIAIMLMVKLHDCCRVFSRNSNAHADKFSRCIFLLCIDYQLKNILSVSFDQPFIQCCHIEPINACMAVVSDLYSEIWSSGFKSCKEPHKSFILSGRGKGEDNITVLCRDGRKQNFT